MLLGEVCKKWIGREGRILMNGIRSYKRGPRGLLGPFYLVWTQRQAAGYEPEKGPSRECDYAGLSFFFFLREVFKN